MFNKFKVVFFISVFLNLFNGSCRGNENNESNNLNTIHHLGNFAQKKTQHTTSVIDSSKFSLLKNSDFEQGVKYWENNLSISSNIRRSGKTSAFIKIRKGEKSKMFTQDIRKVSPGDVLEFSGWIKGKEVMTEDINSEKGAAIFLQGYDKLNKYIKGEFSTSLTGTFDWTFVKGFYIVPEGVSKIKFGFFLRDKSYGQVWFDDLNVNILQKKTQSVKKNIKSHKDINSKVYIDQEGFTVKDGFRFFPLILFLGEGPKAGDWANSDDNLNKIASAGFNTVMSYYYGDRPEISTFFKSTKKHNLNVVFSLKDLYDGLKTYRNINEPAITRALNIVSKFKNEPNLLAWYINDELGLGKYSSIENIFNSIKKEDDNHPTFQVDYKVENLQFLRDISDVLGTDPYPVDKKNVQSLSLVSDWTKKTVEAAGGDKGVWQVVQLVDLAFAGRKDARAPNLQEMRNMAYQAIINGAKGLSFYNFHWLWFEFDKKGKRVFSEKAFSKRWVDVNALIKEISGITPLILADNQVLLKEIDNSDVVHKCYEMDGKHYLFLANPESVSKRIVLSSDTTYKGFSIPPHVKNIKAKIVNKEIVIDLGRFESGWIVLN